MKKFDLESARAGAPVCTRDGRKARIVCYDGKIATKDYPIVAFIECSEDGEDIQTYTIDGNSLIGEVRDADLVMAPVHHEGWVNVYRSDNNYMVTDLFSTKEKAEALASEDDYCPYVATAKIEWED